MAKSFSWVLTLGILGAACLFATADGGDASPPLPKIHPKVFEMVECWISDTEEPVVTEVNLDAIAKNRNQFDFSTVKKDGEWMECPTEDGRGFRRFKELKTEKGHFAVEYHSNGGGTLNTASIIEFSIEKRELRKDGKLISVQVLRIISVANK